MRKKRPSPKVSRATSELLAQVQASMSSTSRFEDRFWESHLEKLIQSHLHLGRDDVIEAALTELAGVQVDQANDLLEYIHAASQSLDIEIEGQRWQVLLTTSAFAVWTRYQLPQVTMSQEDVAYFVQGLKQTVLAPDVMVHAIPKLLGLDEMPRSYSEIYQWLEKLADGALGKNTTLPRTITLEPNPALLVDTRHFVLAIAVPQGNPAFRWQADLQVSQSDCLTQWVDYISPRLSQMMPGCQFHALLTQSYHSSIELSERHVRLVAIRCASQWLHETLNLQAGNLRASIAAVGEGVIQEYRIGFYRKGEPDVIYGTIWPVFDEDDWGEDETVVDTFDEIAVVLKDCGVQQIKRIPGILWPQSCDDCTAPFFPDVNGDLVHVELPEEAFDAPQHFH